MEKVLVLRLNPFAVPLLAHCPKAGAIEGGRDGVVLAVGSLWEAALPSARPRSPKPLLCPATAELAAGSHERCCTWQGAAKPMESSRLFPFRSHSSFPFQMRSFCLSSFFSSHAGWSPLLPTLPNCWGWAWGQTPSEEHGDIQGRRGSYEERAAAMRGVPGFGGLLRCCLTSIDSFPVVI